MSKYKSLITDTILFALGNLGSKIILFFLLPLYTYTLSTAEYGTVEYIETLTNLIYPVLSLVIYESILRFTITQTEKKEEILLVGIIVLLCSSVLTVITITLISDKNAIAEWKWFLCFNIIICMFYQLFMAYIKAIGQIKIYAILSMSSTFILALLNIFFLIEFKLGIEGYLLALLCSRGGVCLWLITCGKVCKDLTCTKFNGKLLIKMISYSAPLVINNVSWWIMQSLDKLMIKEMLDMDALGLYTAASKIPALINMFVAIFSQAWRLSAIREYDTSKDTNFYSRILEIYSFFIPLVASLFILLVKPFMKIYVSSEYYEAWIFIPLLVVSAAFSALSAFYESIYNALEKSTRCMITAIVAAILNFALNYMMIPKIGIMGAVVATVISYGVITVCRIVDIYFIFPFRMYPTSMLINYVIIILQATLIIKRNVNGFLFVLTLILIVTNINLVKYLLKSLLELCRKK